MATFRSTFGTLRPQCPTPTIALTSGGNLAAGSAYLWAVRQNRVGFDIPVALGLQTWTANQKIVITLPSAMRGAGEDVHRIWILAADTNNAAIAIPLAQWRAYTLVQIGGSGFYSEVQAALPATVELTRPEQVVIGGVAANALSLAAIAYPIDGMVRYLNSTAQSFYYDPTSSAIANGTTVIASSGAGRWIPWLFPPTFALGSVTDTTAQYGANRDTRSLIDSDVLIPPPSYRMDGTSSQGVIYTLLNGTTESGSAIAAGTRILLDAYQSGDVKSQFFTRRITAVVLGYVRFSDGTLTTDGLTVGSTITYTYGQQIYTLEADLPPGYGVVIKISFTFKKEELDGRIGSAPLSVALYFSSQSGNFFPGSEMWGTSIIYPAGNFRRVYPKRGQTALIGIGSGMVQASSFSNAAAFDLTLPTANVSDHKITLNGNGDVFYRGADALDPSEVLRATIALAAGRSNPSTATAYTAIAASGGIEVTVTYPTAIRSDYPDSAIAGALTSIGFQMNAPFVCLYLQRQSDGQIREFINYATTATLTQTFTVTDFTSGTVIGSLPNTVGNFGLFASTPASTISAIAGSFAADSYRVHWGFRYDGTTISDINHSATGAVPENRTSIGELSGIVSALQTAIGGWQNGTSNIDVLNLLVRGIVSLNASNVMLNADAAQSGADWFYNLVVPAAGMTANQTLTLPANQGEAQRALVGDGTGILQYASVMRIPAPVPLNFNSAASVAFFTLLANDFLRMIEVQIVTAFNGTAPAVAVGIAGNTGRYIAAGNIDLQSTAGSLLLYPNRLEPPSADESLILTYTASTASVGSARFIPHFFG
jgi:hypothetical protein